MKRLILNLYLLLALILSPAALGAKEISAASLTAQVQDEGHVVLFENQNYIGYLMPQLFLKDWKFQFFNRPGRQDDCEAVAKLPDGNQVNFTVTLKALPSGLKVHCVYVPKKDLLFVDNREGVFFPYEDWTGDDYQIEKQKDALPTEVVTANSGVLAHSDGPIQLGPSHKGGMTVGIQGNKLHGYLQDVRQWTPDLSVYYTDQPSAGNEHPWKAGEKKIYDITLTFNRKVKVQPMESVKDLDGLKTQVDAVLKPILEGGWCPGMAVGVMLNGQTRVWGYGKTKFQDGHTPDGDTEYELGSITKLFTKLLFSDMVHQGAMGLEDKAQAYLPANVKLPTKNGKEITLLMLSKHTSGLAHDPETWSINSSANYSRYGLSQLYDYLSHTQLLTAPGDQFGYSNTGVALLGDLVARRKGLTWENYLQQRILDQVEMKDTGVRWTPSERERAAQGYDGDGYALKLWDWQQSPIMPAGSLHSTVNDLLKLARAAMDKKTSPLADIAFDDIAEKLDWGRQVNHDGGTYGFNSSFHVDRDKKQVLVVLGDTGGAWVSTAASRIRSLMEGKLATTPTYPELVANLPPDVKAYVGKYHSTKKPQGWDPFHNNNDELILKDGKILWHTDGGWITDFRLYPLANGNFYSKRGMVEVVFTKDGQGTVTGFTLKGNPMFISEKVDYKKPAAKDDGIPPPP